MMIPATYAVALLLTVVSMLCWGSWANTMKLAGKWRFELYYFDYTFGVVLCATIAAFTFGSIESNTPYLSGPAFSFTDNLAITGKAQMAYAAAGGVVFNLANLLLVAAIAVAGLSVAFPVGIGLALIVGVVLNFIVKPAGSPAMLAAGVGLVFLAIIATALAHAAHKVIPAAATAAEAVQTAAGARAVQRPGVRRASSGSTFKGVALALAAGLLMGLFYPLVELSKRSDFGLGPYAAAFCFSIGVLLSTPVFNLFFMNLPVEGEPVSIGQYFKGTTRQHLLGILGGVIWCAGTVANFVASSAPGPANVGPAVSYAIGQGATLISTLWGLFVWKEFAGASPAVKLRLALMLLLFTAGLALLSLAPLYS